MVNNKFQLTFTGSRFRLSTFMIYCPFYLSKVLRFKTESGFEILEDLRQLSDLNSANIHF